MGIEELTAAERDVVEIVWDRGEATANEARDAPGREGLLDSRRDRRTRVCPLARCAFASGLLVLVTLVGTTRGQAAKETEPTTIGESKQEPSPKDNIQWTGVPKVDRDDPALHRGIVLGPDGKPLPGAAVYAVADIGLPDLALRDRLSVKDLGPQRSVTDTRGRFEFTANDLTFITPAGKRGRLETLLVTTKDGLAPGWFRAWGEVLPCRRYFFDPSEDEDVLIRTRPPATLAGHLEFEDGRPITGARVEVVTLCAPIDYDLDRHLDRQERIPHTVRDWIEYAGGMNWPRILGPSTEAATDAQGRFELSGLPEGFIAILEVTHPEAVTSQLRVAIRAIEPIREDPSLVPGPLTLYGSPFTARLAKGITLSGRLVRYKDPLSPPAPAVPAAGATVALWNPNIAEGLEGRRFVTNADGMFTVTGLPDRPEGHDLAFVGSFAAPYDSTRWHFPQEEHVPPGYVPNERRKLEFELLPAVRYRLRITDPAGRSVDRAVYSTFVQTQPGEVRRNLTSSFDRPRRLARGFYEGIVPTGPAVVLVSREFMTDRPAAVDPKAFFEPGRTDWTPEEERYAYGNVWRIALPAIAPGDAWHPELNPTRDQLLCAAAVFTNAKNADEVLDLQATVYSDPPVTVTLVDDAGHAVERATVTRQCAMKEFHDSVLPDDASDELPATFSVCGLHPERAEPLLFMHEERGLVGLLSAKWSREPQRVVMRPATILAGRLVDKSGKPSADFGIRLKIGGFTEDVFTFRWFATEKLELTLPTTPFVPDNTFLGELESGRFQLFVPAGAEIQGQIVRMRKNGQIMSPSLGTAFGPLTAKGDETVDLGDITVP